MDETGHHNYQEFRETVGKMSDREILLDTAWRVYQTHNQVRANGVAIVALRERVDDIEKQANDAMANLTTPEAMMGMAEKFLGS